MGKKSTPVSLVWVLVMGGCAGYVPGQQAYWDAQVREMCAKDGGVKIFENLHISRRDIELLGRIGGSIAIPSKNAASTNAPAYSELKITEIRGGNPRISRSESTVIRRADQAILAKWVVYSRSGGDFPTGLAEGTSFICPDLKSVTSNLQRLFVIEKEK